jgi:hypothetical protein
MTAKEEAKFEFSGSGDLLLKHFAGSMEQTAGIVSPSGRGDVTDSSMDLNEDDLLQLHA